MKIVLIGAGNVATQLALALKSTEHSIVQVFSRTAQSAAALAERISAPYTHDFHSIDPNADLYIYALSDDALMSFIQLNLAPHAVHIHTAGSVDITVFRGYKERFGVLYPLQTISKDKTLDFKQVPLLIEASDKETEQLLYNLATDLSDNVYAYDSKQRLQTHLSAVFVNNFVNYLFQIAADLMEEAKMDFEVLKPLIRETVEKLNYLSPAAAQTGPAKRNDQAIMLKHLELLKDKPELQKIYQALSKMILNQNLHQS